MIGVWAKPYFDKLDVGTPIVQLWRLEFWVQILILLSFQLYSIVLFSVLEYILFYKGYWK